ncbi:MAG: AEC family transporter [Oscillospiraceae bacterium]|nr:AEC family transporter [Oscillospiraceae bacterium]
MNTALLLMSKLAAMLTMVAVGWLAVRFRIVQSRDSAVLSRLTVYILQPCLICRAFQIELTPERLNGFLCALVFGTAVYIIWILALGLLKKPLRLDAVDRCSLIYSNVGNLALPLISMILGSEYVFYASALQIPFNLLIWTHGNSIICGEKHLHIRKILLNPNIIALFIGLLLSLLQIRLPDFLDTAAGGLGNMVGPVSMLLIGMVVSEKDLRKIFTDGRAWMISLGRLIAMPASLLLLLSVSGVCARLPQWVPVFQVCFIALCTPPASTVAQLAVLYDKKAYETGVYGVQSMLLCVLTMPLMLTLFQLLFL